MKDRMQRLFRSTSRAIGRFFTAGWAAVDFLAAP